MRLSAAAGLPTRAVVGVWWRAVRLRYLPDPLATAHTRTYPGRFNAGTSDRPGPQVLYLAADLLTAQFEAELLFGSPQPGRVVVPNPAAVGWSLLPVTVSLTAVVDLTDPAVLAALRTSVQELTGDWQGYTDRPPVPPLRSPYWSNVPTQRLGHALHAAGVSGFLAASARVPARQNLVVFPANLLAGGFVTCTDPGTGVTHRRP